MQSQAVAEAARNRDQAVFEGVIACYEAGDWPSRSATLTPKQSERNKLSNGGAGGGREAYGAP
jgi:hypothetical protein